MITAYDEDENLVKAFAGKYRKDGTNFAFFVGYHNPATSSRWVRELTALSYTISDLKYLKFDPNFSNFVVLTFQYGILKFSPTGNLIFAR